MSKKNSVLKDKISKSIVPFLASLFIRFVYFSARKKYIIKADIPDEPIIIASWHGKLILPPIFYAKVLRKNRPNLFMMISEHKDGEYIAKTMEYFGLNSIRGSSTRGGAKVLISAIKKLKDGCDVAITPDGTKGPNMVVQDGIVALSLKTNTKIVALDIKVVRFWQFNS